MPESRERKRGEWGDKIAANRRWQRLPLRFWSEEEQEEQEDEEKEQEEEEEEEEEKGRARLLVSFCRVFARKKEKK